ncbi:MAG: hypothetical protein MZV70_77330 [Desulfobacterales bacterium]|nr:hypothetical protein [Desulfobacterales bacterium]
MAKEKVYKLAQEFKVSSEALVQMLRGMGIPVKEPHEHRWMKTCATRSRRNLNPSAPRSSANTIASGRCSPRPARIWWSEPRMHRKLRRAARCTSRLEHGRRRSHAGRLMAPPAAPVRPVPAPAAAMGRHRGVRHAIRPRQHYRDSAANRAGIDTYMPRCAYAHCRADCDPCPAPAIAGTPPWRPAGDNAAATDASARQEESTEEAQFERPEIN